MKPGYPISYQIMMGLNNVSSSIPYSGTWPSLATTRVLRSRLWFCAYSDALDRIDRLSQIPLPKLFPGAILTEGIYDDVVAPIQEAARERYGDKLPYELIAAVMKATYSGDVFERTADGVESLDANPILTTHGALL